MLSIKTKPVILLLALATTAAILSLGYGLYMTTDFSHKFLSEKGDLTKVKEQFLHADSQLNNYEVFLTDSTGYELPCLVRAPKDSSRRYPALVVLNGFRTGKQVVTFFENTDSVVLISFDWPAEAISEYSVKEIALFLMHADQNLLRSVSLILTIIDYLEQRADVNKEQIAILGASFAVPWAVTAASLDQRIKAVILLYGGGNTGQIFEWNLRARLNNDLGGKALVWLLNTLFVSVEPMKYIDRISPRPLLMVNGKNDISIPAANTMALYNKAKEPKEIIWLDTKHIAPKISDLTSRLEKILNQWIIDNI